MPDAAAGTRGGRWARRLRSAVAAAAAGAFLGAGGCGTPEGMLRIESRTAASALTAPVATAVYSTTDRNTADLYLSDLPVSVLANPANDLRSVSGVIVHVHMFIYPEAGRIPVGRTACNTTLRCVVLTGGPGGGGDNTAGGAGATGGPAGSGPAASGASAERGDHRGGQNGSVGVYGGGGFFVPDGSPGPARFSGQVRDSTLCLIRADSGFADRLGPAMLRGGLAVSRDEPAVRAIRARLETLVASVPAVAGE